MAKLGRPSSYTDAIAQEICDRLSMGEPLAQICRDEGMPHTSTVYDWRDAREDFSRRFARAREDGFDRIAADALEIANTQEMGEIVTEKGDGTREVKFEDMLGHRKLQIETRLKLLAKWDPKRYGEATLLKHADADGNNLDLAAQMAAARDRAAGK